MITLLVVWLQWPSSHIVYIAYKMLATQNCQGPLSFGWTYDLNAFLLSQTKSQVTSSSKYNLQDISGNVSWILPSTHNSFIAGAEDSTFKIWQLPGPCLLLTRKGQEESRMRKTTEGKIFKNNNDWLIIYIFRKWRWVLHSCDSLSKIKTTHEFLIYITQDV